MRRSLSAVALLVSVLAAACSSAPDSDTTEEAVDPVETAAATITAEDYARRIGVLAHDSMGGRLTPSPGLETAATWIAGELEAMGLRGGGPDGGFIQRYDLPRGEGDAPNVVAVLEGSDPALRDEYLVYSAHMDHVGIRTPDEAGDSIWNGADDNASGTTAVLEVAEAMASLPTAPRRSVIFLLVSGEERGLWGSEYYADNPTVPAGQIVANLNADMVGRNWPDTIVAIGKEHSDLGTTLERVNAAHPELGMTAIDDLWPDENFYARSDHYNFARKGVPILFFFNGTHDDYHGRDDEVDRIDTDKASRIARLLFYLGMEIADADQRPEWNPDSYREIVGEEPDSGMGGAGQGG